MKYFNSNQSLYSKGIFIGCIEGYATFQLENNEIIYFEQINKKIEHHYDLKSNRYKNKSFDIYYTEIFDDLDEEEFIIFRLDDLKLL
ncbi:MAG: hypothetical protein HN595_04385 [Flavobacteriaceae bacterium]|jgi:hypothetical protein|nr:hypothetical protein [Flavobacteriaceae bacterium]